MSRSPTESKNLVAAILPLYGRVWRKLDRRRRWQLGGLSILILATVVAEIVSLGAILPLVAVFADPPRVMHHATIGPLLQAFGLQTGDEVRNALVLLFLSAALMSGFVRLLYVWLSLRLSSAIGSDFAQLAFSQVLHRPYADLVRMNSSTFITGVIVKLQSIIWSGLMPLFTIIGAAVSSLAIAVTLVVISPGIAAFLVVTVGLLQMILVLLSRMPLTRAGQRLAVLNTNFMFQVQTAMGGIREILLEDTQTHFVRSLSQTERALRRASVFPSLMVSAPRYILETGFIVIVALLTFYLSSRDDGLLAALPVLSAIALGAQKLLPAANQISAGWATIQSAVPSMQDALALFEDEEAGARAAQPVDPLPFDSSIAFHDVWFRYSEDGPWILKGIDLSIAKGERIGLVGKTGSGKSTLIDLLMGLLEAQKGRIEVDGTLLQRDARRAWRRHIAHVPQSIYLIDASVAENIAFGTPRADISTERVVEAAHRADMDRFVDDGQHGFATRVGERGVQLSGGQRQRIGLARALYKDADVIVLDEATSALDDATEARIMKTIESLGRNTTIVMIAHRLTTLKNCDRIFVLDEGVIQRVCRYDEL